jgi:TonB-dependent SusC/RagA subfamily outer membrane receptor
MKLKILLCIFLILAVDVNILTSQRTSKKVTVSGYVTGTDGNSVRSAPIMIDNKKTLVNSDENGYYRIRIKPGATTISVIAPYHQPKSQLIAGQTTINFILEEISGTERKVNENGEPEELVDIGYKTIDIKSSPVQASKLDVSDNENSTYNNIYEMIQGKIPGLDVIGKKIRIRGINSLVGDNDPMFVVNGMPVNSIDNILPVTVQSITVLKGPSAAIYGSRGVNGVIVITLKKPPRTTE